MKVFCLYYKDNFVVSFPNREDCVDYGKRHYEGAEWDCNIIEMYLHNSSLPPFSQPYNPLSAPQHIPCTPPIPLKTTPHTPNIWCGDVIKYKVDYTQTPKTND